MTASPSRAVLVCFLLLAASGWAADAPLRVSMIPTTDPSRSLDFHQLMEDKASDPTAWPEPFRREPTNPPPLIEIGPDHWVEARAPPPAMAARVGDAVSA